MSTFLPAHSPFDEQGAEFEDVRKAIALASGNTAATVRASSHYNNARIY